MGAGIGNFGVLGNNCFLWLRFGSGVLVFMFFDSVQAKASKRRWGPVEGGSGMEIGPNVERTRKTKQKKERARLAALTAQGSQG